MAKDLFQCTAFRVVPRAPALLPQRGLGVLLTGPSVLGRADTQATMMDMMMMVVVVVVVMMVMMARVTEVQPVNSPSPPSEKDGCA
jgi:hypothetical protein